MKPSYTIFLTSFLVLSMASCIGPSTASSEAELTLQADTLAMRLLSGIWLDSETETVVCRVEGDSIFYPDSTVLPVRFAIYEDTLYLFTADTVRYPIVKQGEYVLSYKSLAGEVITFHRSESPLDSLYFFAEQREYAPLLMNEEVSRDTVVFSPSNERYHLYIKVNPTRYRVYQTTYTDEGLATENVYFDNIIHVSVFQGRNSLFSHDFVKSDFQELVPEAFLEGALLSNTEFGVTDHEGFHFNVTICQPNGASCYVVDLLVRYDGQLQMNLSEY